MQLQSTSLEHAQHVYQIILAAQQSANILVAQCPLDSYEGTSAKRFLKACDAHLQAWAHTIAVLTAQRQKPIPNTDTPPWQ